MRLHSLPGFCGILAGLFTIGTFGSVVSGDEPAKKDLSSREILDRLAKAYAGCESYRDSGEVSITFIENGNRRLDIRPFKTAFIRPDRFRYEYVATNPANKTSRYLIWRNKDEVQSWWDITPGVKKPESLALAVASATGVSGGSAHTVPTMLMPKELGGARLSDFPNLKRGEDDKLDGIECYRIEGVVFKAPTTYWIEKKTFLLRKIAATTDFGTFQTEQTTSYKPTFGEKIPEDALVFDPPRPKDD